MTSLTRLVLDPRHPAAKADLADVDSLHKTLMRLVPDHIGPTPRATAGLLFRAEPGTDPVLLVQTAHTPDLTALPTRYGTARTLDLTPLLNALTPGRTMRYRITAAPTVARSAGNPTPHPVTGKRRGKITHLTGDDAIAWWQRRATAAGLEPVTVSCSPRPFPRTRITRSAPYFTLTQFDGLARITDTTHLTHALKNGIGRAKSYGAGLLSLAPA
ncbi:MULTISPECIES: type I-E CRISPR-associated protein Cas6/Cse3/CasE [Streptomyces]|uniref:CRISPR-associated endoribonuclease Cse3 n=1 Tax=Streptomyces chartreusis NRRL 3882 TaxID=1079985 RepID=A0A2N9AZT8_STRCX|nr:MULTISPECIES: type I-E CRISPR-associated protein Cas6/Cse3/CasE [Streptomyces]MYS95614.1 type I-E CRISPR-associated protein Cas6/Cse3/CasE [Streptomyces sp. SID5464]SOR76581.1 CRISPR-associated endoribonuclease Cse3 [Streptomyces chartreusis NRRL 3882]